MTNLKNKLQPLNWTFPIVDSKGAPTPEFQRAWAQQQATNKTIIDLTNATALSSLLDLITSTQGSIIYRGASLWTFLPPGTSGYALKTQGAGANVTWAPYVTSVALALDSGLYTVSGSPVTTSGTLTGTLNTQTANYIFAGPTSGMAAKPTFRAMVSADIPSSAALAGSPTTTTQTPLTNNTTIATTAYADAAVAAGGGATGAESTATAGPVAVNGSAATFLRSDGAPAIQKASNSQFGIVEVDGTTITAASGVISAVTTGVVASSPMWFGNGHDGDVSITTTVTLARDMYYHNLTISGSGILKTIGYRVYVSGTLDISAAGAGAITNSCAQTQSATKTSLGGIATNTVGGSGTSGTADGGNGGTAGNIGSNGNNSSPGSATIIQMPGRGGSGGASGVPHAGGNAGTVPADNTGVGLDIRVLRQDPWAMSRSTGALFILLAGIEGSGGGGGGADASNAGGNGGGCGSGGASVWIMANIIARGTNSTASIIQALGGAGQNGSNGAGGTAGGGGGGGGGCGGWIYIGYGSLTGSTITNALDTTGGPGGAGGNSPGAGTGGNGGQGGGGGRIDVYNIGAGTYSITEATAATAANSASGATGGGAKTATAQLANL